MEPSNYSAQPPRMQELRIDTELPSDFQMANHRHRCWKNIRQFHPLINETELEGGLSAEPHAIFIIPGESELL